MVIVAALNTGNVRGDATVIDNEYIQADVAITGGRFSSMPDTTVEDFTALVRRAGLALTEAQIAELYGAWGYVETMLARNRMPALAREAEPSHIFKPEEF